MSAAYIALIVVLLAGVGARDQVTVAGLTTAQGQRPSVLALAIAISFATAAFAGWAASFIAPDMLPAARLFLVAIALAFAGVESMVIVPRPRPREPTNSLGATALVLLTHQLTDAARFMIFGIAVLTVVPVPAAIGGALGGAALVGIAWLFPETVLHSRTRLARRLVGAILFVVAIWLGLTAMGTL